VGGGIQGSGLDIAAQKASERLNGICGIVPRLNVFVVEVACDDGRALGNLIENEFHLRLRQRAVPKTSRCVLAMVSDRPEPQSRRRMRT